MSNEEVLDRFFEMVNEIKKIGWDGILEIYHPDINVAHPKAFELFQLYKEIYEKMKEGVIP